MGAGAAQVQARQRPPVLGVAGERAVEQKLVEGQFTLEDVALGQPHLLLQLVGGAHFAVQNQVLEVWAVLRDLIYHRPPEGVPGLRRPRAVRQGGRAILHEHRHHVLARRRQGRIHRGGNQHVQVWVLGPSAGLPVVIGPLQPRQGVREVHVRQQQRAVLRQGGEGRQPVQGDVKLAG